MAGLCEIVLLFDFREIFSPVAPSLQQLAECKEKTWKGFLNGLIFQHSNSWVFGVCALRETETETERETETDRDRDSERQRQRDRETERDRDREELRESL